MSTSKSKSKKMWMIVGAIVLVIAVARLTVNYFVTSYVNKVLSEIPGYYGSIYDVDIRLFRGAYVIDSLKILKIEGNRQVPFVDIPVTDLSIEWQALFNGSIAGEVVFRKPKLNFIGGDSKDNNQTGEDIDWTEPVKKLVPFQLNRLEIEEGTVYFHDFTSKPQVSISLNDLHLLATNLNNAEKQKERLPSSVTATATSMGGGILNLQMDINPFSKIPDLDMNLEFEQIDMPALNEFFMAYAKVDVETGSFNFYSEMVVDNGVVEGYVKPIAQNVKIVSLEDDKQKPLNMIWQSMVGLLKDVFKNQKEDQFATKVPLQGNLNNVDASFWPTIWNIFRNAFVRAFDRNTEGSVMFADNSITADRKVNETKKETRKRERMERKKKNK